MNGALHRMAGTESSYISAYGLVKWPEPCFHQTHRVPGPSAASSSLFSKPYSGCLGGHSRWPKPRQQWKEDRKERTLVSKHMCCGYGVWVFSWEFIDHLS